jgi:8-oxo-dGTP diphosphatase
MRVVSVAYVGFTAHNEPAVAGSDAADVRLWAIDDLAIPGFGSLDGVPLAFDHAQIIADAIERSRAKLEYTTLATAFLDEPFTLGELRRVYEAVWGEALHEGNFRRKVLSTPGFVEPTGGTAPTDGRPAALYRRGTATRLHPPILRP